MKNTPHSPPSSQPKSSTMATQNKYFFYFFLSFSFLRKREKVKNKADERGRVSPHWLHLQDFCYFTIAVAFYLLPPFVSASSFYNLKANTTKPINLGLD